MMTQNQWTQGVEPETHSAAVEAPTAASTAATAKHEATDLGQSAAESAGNVVTAAKNETAVVASEAASQAKDLFARLRTDLADHASAQQQKLATGVRSAADEFRSMADATSRPGSAGDMVRRAADRSASVASWLEGRDPAALLDDVRGFARQRPVAFLAIAAGVGVLAGRLTRGISGGTSAGSSNRGTSGPGGRHTVSAAPVSVAARADVAPAVQPYGARDTYVEPTLAVGQAPASASTLPGAPDRLVDEQPVVDGGRS